VVKQLLEPSRGHRAACLEKDNEAFGASATAAFPPATALSTTQPTTRDYHLEYRDAEAIRLAEQFVISSLYQEAKTRKFVSREVQRTLSEEVPFVQGSGMMSQEAFDLIMIVG
jgi:hypothetical protein